MDREIIEIPDTNIEAKSTSDGSRSILKPGMSSNLKLETGSLDGQMNRMKKRSRSIGFAMSGMNPDKIEALKAQEANGDAESDNDSRRDAPSLGGSVSFVEPAINSPLDTPEAIEVSKRMRKAKGSEKSFDSFNSGGSGPNSSGKPLVENISSKFLFFRSAVLAFFLNALLFVYAIVLVSPQGFLIKIPMIQLDEVAPVMLVTLMFVIHISTYHAFNDALSVYFAMLLTHPKGFPVSVTGLMQSSFLQKLFYSAQISVRSKAKRVLSRASLAYLIHVCFLITPILAVLEMRTTVRETDGGTLSCIEYHQKGRQHDRGWPTFQLEMGVGEYVFGTSIGILRSQEDVPFTTFIMPPQLTDTCNDGTTISGNGFIAHISTSCNCAGSPNATDLMYSGIPAADAQTFQELFSSLGFSKGMVNGIYQDRDTMTIHSLIANSNVCGGGMSTPVPVCSTNITGLSHALIKMVYMTDGTPASIAAKHATILETRSLANMTWLFRGYEFAMGSRIAALEMPALFPSTVNSLLWWTTQSTLQISASLLEAGIETTVSLLNKAVIQRAFGTEGKLCPQTVVIPDERVARTTGDGLRYILVFALAQTVAHLFCGVIFLIWVFHKRPIVPAIRFVKERSYFAIFSSGLAFNSCLSDLTATFEEGHFWPKFEMTMRVGESIHTLDDPDYGTIVIDRPKMVGDLSFTKLYL
jgi:hypothetical protein